MGVSREYIATIGKDLNSPAKVGRESSQRRSPENLLSQWVKISIVQWKEGESPVKDVSRESITSIGEDLNSPVKGGRESSQRRSPEIPLLQLAKILIVQWKEGENPVNGGL